MDVLDGYADWDSIAPAHLASTAYLVYQGVVQGRLMGGNSYLGPLENLARAQAVAMLLRAKSVTFEVPTLHLTVSGISNPATAGVASSVVVSVRDEANSIFTVYRGTVHFTSTDPAAVLPANYTFTAADAGTHTFTGGVTLKTAGSRTVTATDIADSGISGSQTVTVNAAAANHLDVTGIANPATVNVRIERGDNGS